jgi:hypothetical protein
VRCSARLVGFLPPRPINLHQQQVIDCLASEFSWEGMRVRKIVISVIGVVLLTSAAVVVVARDDIVRVKPSATYHAAVWLSRDDSRAQANLVRSQCGYLEGAAASTEIVRSSAARTKGELVFGITMRWGPADTRSNQLLNCLNNNPGIDHYGIGI